MWPTFRNVMTSRTTTAASASASASASATTRRMRTTTAIRWLLTSGLLLVITTTHTNAQTVYSEYRPHDITNFSSVLIRNQDLLVAGRNYIVRLDGRSMQEVARKALLPDQNRYDADSLENYIRIAPIGTDPNVGDRFLSCEANAAESICRVLPYTLETPRSSDMQQAMVTDQNHNDRTYTSKASQLLFNNVLLGVRPLVRPRVGSDIDIYVGGPFSREDNGVIRVPFNRSERKIDYAPPNWFAKTASFVAMFEVDGAVYAFLREPAAEARVGAIAPIYARVVRICKADCGVAATAGGLPMYRWGGMLKVRLLCSALPRVADTDAYRESDRFTVASAPLEFNYLHHVTFDERGNMFYATFTTITPDAPKAVASVDSAVCAYSRDAIINGFRERHFLVDDNANNGRFSWSVNRSSPLPDLCPLSASKPCESFEMNKRFRREVASREVGKSSLLLAGAIEPDRRQPLVLAEMARFNQLATHSFTLNGVRFTAIFVLDFDLVLRKYVVRSATDGSSRGFYVDQDSCLLETFDVGAAMQLDQDTERYTSMYRPTAFRMYSDKTGDQRWLVATFGDRVVRVAVSDCAQHRDRSTCVSSRDVLCGWSVARRRCESVSRFDDSDWAKTAVLLAFAANRTDACQPQSQTRAEWTSWSSWETCSREVDGVQRTCECRTRDCRRQPLAGSPEAPSWRAADGANVEDPDAQSAVAGCDGSRVEVRNCATDGGWTAWSAWSACPSSVQQCQQGVSTQRRTRSCTNPAPRFGGASCVGDEIEQRLCDCDQMPRIQYVYGNWSSWQPTPLAQFSAAVQQCAATASKTLGYSVTLLSRTRSCQIEGAGPTDVLAPCPNMFESRLCLTAAGNEAMCMPTQTRLSRSGDFVNDRGFSEWTAYSACSGSCGVGLQSRTRACVFPSDFANATVVNFEQLRTRYCNGSLQETRNCKLVDCPSQSNVSIATCWSDWSDCYELSPGRRISNRTRSCVYLRQAEMTPSILTLSGEELNPYRVACPPQITTVEFTNCSVASHAVLPVAATNRLAADPQMDELRKPAAVSAEAPTKVLAITSAICLLIGLAIGLLVAVLVSRAAYRNPNAACARRTASLLCSATEFHVEHEPESKTLSMSVTQNPSYEVHHTPSAARKQAALSFRRAERRSESTSSDAARQQHMIGDPSALRCEPRANVPLPPLPHSEHLQLDNDATLGVRSLRLGSSSSTTDRPGLKTPKRHRPAPLQIPPQSNALMNNGEQLDSPPAVYTSSAYSSISSEHEPQLTNCAQQYRAPASPTKRTPQPAELRARLFVNSPLPASDHEMKRSEMSAAHPSRTDLQTPTRFSKLANPSLSRVPSTPSHNVIPQYIPQQSINDSQYAVPNVVLGNMDTLISTGGTMHSACGMHGRVNAMTLTNTSGVSSLASTLHTRTLGGRSHTPQTLSRPKFRAASVSSTTADEDTTCDIHEEMRQITKKLLRDDGDAV